MRPTATATGLVRTAATEDQLWSYLVQLASALRAVHMGGGALRAPCLTPSKVCAFAGSTNLASSALDMRDGHVLEMSDAGNE